MKETEIVQAKLKHKVEDFIVEEIGDGWSAKVSEELGSPESSLWESSLWDKQPELVLDSENSKEFLWCEMEKQDIDHFSAIKELSIRLNKKPFDIGYAGSKDKRAWTSQRISIFQPDLEKIKNFQHPNIILKNFNWNKRKIKMGYLEGNHFKITLRDIDKKGAMKITKHIRSKDWFPNYFGPQRFGINGNNVKIGKLILKRKFEEAIQEISDDNLRQKEIFQYYLSKNPEDFIGTLRRAERKSMLMYVNAVQSKIFNEILEEALEEGLTFTKQGQTSCLLIGYKTRFFNGRLGEIEQQVLASHNLTLEDFDIKEIPYLRIKGSFRKAITEIKDLQIEVEDDEEFEGSKKIILEFTLPSGVYATTFLENFFVFN
ncbi:MAG: tRNA pseudouridine(13) synthase TruD [Nanoarchaeota archaeon]|nr:tRNA pseudouridine(13) synthase TruD [Nanoarchaeota archaeon]